MALKGNLILISLALLFLAGIQSACGSAVTATSVPPTPIESGPSTPPPGSALASIDSVLQNAVMGRIAYNAPSTMQLDHSLEIQLLLSPSAGPDELKNQIVETGQVTEAEVLVSPLMQAELLADDPAAFVIQPFLASPEQVVLADNPTEWRWSVTAKKAGSQVLTLLLKRQVLYNGEYTWRLVQTYKNTILISVSAGQQLQKFDWKWLAGILLTAILIPALWRIIDQRNKKKKGSSQAPAEKE